jgi:hypothetical protein
MLAAVGSVGTIFMAKLRATPAKPTASTVETVDVLNSSKKDAGTNFLRRRSAPPTSTLEVELPPEFPTRTSPRKHKELPNSTPEVELPPEYPTRTSPRKRKEPPTEVVPEPSKLRRVTRTSDAQVAGLVAGSPTPLQRSSTQPVNVGKRQNVYDPPEADGERQPAATAPARVPRKRQLVIRRGGKVTFEDFQDIGLPAASPAKGTRSHDQSQEISTPKRKDLKKASLVPIRKRQPNTLAQAAKEVAEANSAEPEEPTSSSIRGRGRPRKVSVAGRIGRPPKAAAARSDEQPAVERTPDPQASADQPGVSGGESEGAAGELPSDAEVEPPSTPQEDTEKSELDKVIAGIEHEVSLHSCRKEWSKILLYAKKALQHSTTIKAKDMMAVLSTIKDIKALYKKINEDTEPDADLDTAQLDIDRETGRLKTLLSKIAARPNKHDSIFVESILIQVIPRMSRMLETALATRFDEKDGSITIDSLKELITLIDIALEFRDLADRAEHKQHGLTNDGGDLLLRLYKNAVSGLKSIRAKYSKVVDYHKMAIERARDAKLRQAEIAREAEEAMAIERQRTEEKAASYDRKLQEERKRNAQAARKSQAKQLEEERQWKEDLMTNRSIQAERLRKKFGLPYRPATAVNAVSRNDDQAVDVDDFDFDDFETEQPQRAQPRPNGVDQSIPRPRPRREATEDIPAPVVEPVWTDEQTTALVWGLKAFRGHDRYQNIMHAPEVRDMFGGKSELDLMQQALYIKQSMTKSLNTSPALNGTSRQDEWSWLRSVRDMVL